MTNAAVRLLRRLAVALLALACLSPMSPAWPDLPPLPALLGLVPEPAASPSPRAALQPFGAAPAVTDVAQTRGALPPPAAPRAGAAAARGGQTSKAGPPAGDALPALPPDKVPRGRYHRVEPGDTAASIAAAYGLRSKWAVYDANPVITHPERLPVGAWLYIPHPSMDPPARPRPGQRGYSPQPSGTVMVDGIWLQLAACESSGNWAIDTGNGYYGGLQFTLSSWRAVGGAGYPHEAHPMEQIARADYLQRIQGWEAWPMCAGKLGLIPQEEADAIVRRARGRQASEPSEN